MRPSRSEDRKVDTVATCRRLRQLSDRVTRQRFARAGKDSQDGAVR